MFVAAVPAIRPARAVGCAPVLRPLAFDGLSGRRALARRSQGVQIYAPVFCAQSGSAAAERPAGGRGRAKKSVAGISYVPSSNAARRRRPVRRAADEPDVPRPPPLRTEEEEDEEDEGPVVVLSAVESALVAAGLELEQIKSLHERRPDLFELDADEILLAAGHLEALGLSDVEVASVAEADIELVDASAWHQWGARFHFAESSVTLHKATQLIAVLSQLGVGQAQAGRILRRMPQLLNVSVEKAQRVVDFLLAEGFTKEELKQCVSKAPLFTYGVESNVAPKLRFLEGLGLSPAAARSVAARAPIFSYGLESNLRPKTELLRSLGFSHAQIASIVHRFPQIFNYAPSSLVPKLDALERAGLPRPAVLQLVSKKPVVLSLSPSSIASKLALLSDIGATPEELAAFPAFLTLSTERIRRRAAFLASRGLPRPSLARMLACADGPFAARVARAEPDEYAAFQAPAAPQAQ
eukprot:tig00000367_g24450.t1